MSPIRKRRKRRTVHTGYRQLRRLRATGTWRGRRAARRKTRAAAIRRYPSAAGLANRAFEAGRLAALQTNGEAGGDSIRIMNRSWNDWWSANGLKTWKWDDYHEIAAKFASGFETGKGIPHRNAVLVPTRKSIGAVVIAMNEEKTIPGVLEQLGRLPLDERIVVVNGSTDHTFWNARRHSDTVVVHYARPLGHDVGRSVGAKLTRSDIVLFLDGDFPIFAEHLVPFIDAVDKGTDVALNDITPYIHLFSDRDPVTIVKELLNRSLNRTDLAANSLTAVPHALSRRALDTIGCENLMVPPKAQALAVRNGLKVDAVMNVDVISKNRVRDKNTGRANPVSELIIGDHLEALGLLMQKDGARLHAADGIRNRRALGGGAL